MEDLSSFFFRAQAGTVIGLSANIACLLSVLLSPYMPQTAEEIQKQVNAPASVNVTTQCLRCFLKAGHKIGEVLESLLNIV